LGVEKIQNGGRWHGNQGAKNVKFTPNFPHFAVMFLVTSTSSGMR
jgi:ribosomal protein L35AE/L33A